ncbi:MAG: 23S rRNA (guanosine(2251)-2'-O)-methyltransferase RlmB, partial [Deltaproteobacteria bacterium]
MKEKTDILFGFHSVYEALKAKKRIVYKIYISKKRSRQRTEKIEILARKDNIQLE